MKLTALILSIVSFLFLIISLFFVPFLFLGAILLIISTILLIISFFSKKSITLLNGFALFFVIISFLLFTTSAKHTITNSIFNNYLDDSDYYYDFDSGEFYYDGDSYDSDDYYSDETYEEFLGDFTGTENTLTDDDVTKVDIHDSKYYGIEVGEDKTITPGVYTIGFNFDYDTYFSFELYTDDQNEKIAASFSEGESLLNVSLNEGDVIVLDDYYDESFELTLTPQANYISLDLENPKPGFYIGGVSASTGEYTYSSENYNSTINVAPSDEPFYSYFSNRYYDGDSFTINENDIITTYVMSDEKNTLTCNNCN